VAQATALKAAALLPHSESDPRHATIVPAHNEIADEAIETAVAMPYGNVEARVVRPEYLIALYLEPSAKTLKRRERTAALLESGKVDSAALQNLMSRFKLTL